MPEIKIGDKVITCRKGDNLRKVLNDNGISPHNGSAEWLNCRGLGTCGTCSVHIKGNKKELNRKERIRLSAPPFCNVDRNLILSCQTKVTEDIEIEKGKGFWGERWKELK